MSSERSDSLRVAAIGDLHVHQDSQNKLQAVFDKVSQTADVLALCGDQTQLGLPQEADGIALSIGPNAPCCAWPGWWAEVRASDYLGRGAVSALALLALPPLL